MYSAFARSRVQSAATPLTVRRRGLAILTVIAVILTLFLPVGGQAAFAAAGQLVLEQLPMDDACQGLVKTGTPPFDAADGEGLDSGTSNCLVRVNDSIFQNYSVSLTGLDAGQSANNVVLEFTIHPGRGAKLQLAGPLGGGLPDGCLSGAGITPASSQKTRRRSAVRRARNRSKAMGSVTSAMPRMPHCSAASMTLARIRSLLTRETWVKRVSTGCSEETPISTAFRTM